MNEEAILLLDDVLVKSDASINFANVSECVGGNYKAMTAIYGLVTGSQSNQQMYIKMLQKAFVSYFGTDAQAEDIRQSQLNSDWIDSGRSHGGQVRRVA